MSLRTALVAGLTIRVLLGMQHSFCDDEAYTYFVSRLSLPDILAALQSSDRHPPLHYMLLHFWARAGSSELWLRLPSIAFALLTIVGVQRLTVRLTGDARTAGLAALITATFFVDWHYDTMARMLAMAQCGCVWAGVALARVTVDNETSPRQAVSLCLCLTAAIYAFYLSAGMLVAAAVTTLVLRPTRRDIWLSLASTVLLCAPLGLLVRTQQGAGCVEVYAPEQIAYHFGLFGPYYIGLVTAFQGLTGCHPEAAGRWTWTVLTLAVLAGQLLGWRDLLAARRDGAVFIACVLASYLGVLLLTTAGLNLFNMRDRYFVLAYPFLNVVTAMALRRCVAAWGAVVGLNLALFASSVASSYLWISDVRPMAERVWAHQRPGDLIVVEQAGAAVCLFNYYYDRDRFSLVRDGDEISMVEPDRRKAISSGGLAQYFVRSVPLPAGDLAFITQHENVFLVTNRTPITTNPPEAHFAFLRSLHKYFELDGAASLQTTTTYDTYGEQIKLLLRLRRKRPPATKGEQALPEGRGAPSGSPGGMSVKPPSSHPPAHHAWGGARTGSRSRNVQIRKIEQQHPGNMRLS